MPESAECQKRRRLTNIDRYRDYDKKHYRKNRKRLIVAKSLYNQQHRERIYIRNLQTRYGLTQVEHESMVKAQNGYCALCKNKITGRLCVDHNHETGKVRELLCVRCNAGLGNFTESVEKLYNAIEYLRKHNNLLLQ
jgi:hypothetical protein